MGRGKKFGAGLLAGFTAALLMTLFLLLLRYLFGVATPSELVGDRIAPLLGVDRFLELLDRFGGYNNLKQIGVTGHRGTTRSRRVRRFAVWLHRRAFANDKTGACW